MAKKKRDKNSRDRLLTKDNSIRSNFKEHKKKPAPTTRRRKKLLMELDKMRPLPLSKIEILSFPSDLLRPSVVIPQPYVGPRPSCTSHYSCGQPWCDHSKNVCSNMQLWRQVPESPSRATTTTTTTTRQVSSKKMKGSGSVLQEEGCVLRPKWWSRWGGFLIFMFVMFFVASVVAMYTYSLTCPDDDYFFDYSD